MIRNNFIRRLLRRPVLEPIYIHVPEYDERGFDVALLRYTADYIEAHPENYAQCQWFESAATEADPASQTWGPTLEAVQNTKHLNGPVCGTKGCVSGTGVVVTGRYAEFLEYREGWVKVGVGVEGADEDGDIYMEAIPVVDWYRAGRVVFGFDSPEGYAVAEWLFAGDRYEPVMPLLLRALAGGANVTQLRDIEHDAKGDALRV